MKNSNKTTYRDIVTIASGQAYSNALDLDDRGARGIDLTMPAEWTAADIIFEFSHTGADGSWHPRIKADSTYCRCTTPVAGASVCTEGELWGAVGSYRFMRLRSVASGAETDQNQAADREIEIILKF